jgi:hypothetical protein
MHPTASLGILALLAFVLVLEFAGAGAYLVASAHADPSDFCYGYAICR